MIIVLYATIVAVPLVWGFLPAVQKKPIPDRMRTLRSISGLMFLGSIGAQIAAPQLFDLPYVLQVSLARPFGSTLAMVVGIVDFLILYALAVLIPGQVFSRRWRGTSASLVRTIGGGLLKMLGRFATWFALYVSFDLVGLVSGVWWQNGLLRLLAAGAILGAGVGITYLSFRFGRHPRELNESMRAVVSMVGELAKKAGGSVRRVLFLETRDTRIANALALGGKRGFVGITTYLLEHLAPDEVEFTVAHELGHLRMRHTLVRQLISIVAVTVAITLIDQVGYYALDGATRLGLFLVRFLIIILTVQIIPYAVYRRQELIADAFAVALTGDRDAAERSLRKIEALNQVQVRERDSVGSTHPATARRIEAITGKRASGGVTRSDLREDPDSDSGQP